MGKISLILWHVGHFFVVVIKFLLALFNHDDRLHKSRFAGTPEIRPLLTPIPPQNTLIIGTLPNGDYVSVHSTSTRKELGNMLITAPTRAGKGLMAISQLLSWKHSVIVNDIKGEFF